MTNKSRIMRDIVDNVEKVLVGKREAIELVVIGLMCSGHILIEDVPGVGKTSLASALSRSINASFRRIQFTPDIMPSDITGFSMYNPKTNEFEFQRGSVFSNFVLADEINRTPPKTQASLLEVMEERQVSIDGVTYPLPKLFMVLATQNPIEYIGTYPLPEAQTDRFLLKIRVDYPQDADEVEIINRYTTHGKEPSVKKLMAKDSLLNLQKYCRQVPISEDLKKKVVKLVNLTRTNKDLIEYGASPRASLGIVMAAKAHALLNGKTYVGIEDIKKMSYPVLRHRIILSFKAEREGRNTDDAISTLLQKL